MSIRIWRSLKAISKYGAVFYAGWMAAFLSALYANKGGIRREVSVAGFESGAGVVDD